MSVQSIERTKKDWRREVSGTRKSKVRVQCTTCRMTFCKPL